LARFASTGSLFSTPIRTTCCLRRFGFVRHVSHYLRAFAILDVTLFCLDHSSGPLSSVEIVHNFIGCLVLPEGWVRFAKSARPHFSVLAIVFLTACRHCQLASFGNFFVVDDSGSSVLFPRFFAWITLSPSPREISMKHAWRHDC
jgi:hypothetical protein